MYLKGLTAVTVTTKSVLYFKVDELDNVTSSMYNVLKTQKTNLNIKLKKLTRSKLKNWGTVSPRFCFLQKLTFNHSLGFLFAMLFLNYTFCFGSLIKRWWTTKSFPRHALNSMFLYINLYMKNDLLTPLSFDSPFLKTTSSNGSGLK